MFFGFFQFIENLIKNNKTINQQININYLYNLMDTNIHLFNSKLRRKQNNIDRLNNEIKNMKKDIEELKINMRNMKLDYEAKITRLDNELNKQKINNKKEIDNLKLKLNKIEENLKCPITQSRINDLAITPSGITYEKIQ